MSNLLEEAQELIEMSLDIAGQDSEYKRKARVWLEKAKSAYQKVLELFPEAPEAAKAKMELAEINFRYAEK